jgi:PAS domain S-box-containing protein
MRQQTSSLVFLQYLTTVFDNLHDAIVLIGVEPNDTFRLLLANEAFFKSTGHSEEKLGKTINEVVSPRSFASLKKRYKKVIATREPVEYTEWYRVPLGRQAYEIKFIPVLNAVGECVQIAGVSRNVTELYNLRLEVQDLRRQLYKTPAEPVSRT